MEKVRRIKNCFRLPSNYWRKKKEKRGQGFGSEYIPYFRVHEIPSKGRSSRVKSWTCNRIHHMVSDLETNFFYWLDWCKDVTDIREQFPLDYQVTVRIARELNIVHPRNTRKGTLHIMTTDFVVNYGTREVAYSCKYKKDLEKKRTQQKMEIEKKYWEEKGVEFIIITEDDIPNTLVNNVRQIHKLKDLTGMISVPSEATRNFLVDKYKMLLRENWTPLELGNEIDRTMEFEVGTGMLLLRHFMATGKLKIDMAKVFNVEQPLEVLD
ncbi:MAG: TnsA endonuclease [Firmicutes bacterium]|nr:TnsA endonuclease [Bacillota bacterium]